MGCVPDWFGRAAMGFPLRTPADGSLHRSGIEAASRFDTRHSPPTIPTHSASAGRYHCALRLIPTSKVLVPTALARYLRRCRSAYGSLRCNRVSAPQVALTPDWRPLFKPNAQSVVCPATPNGSPAHTQCSNRLVAPLPLFASPVLSLRSEVVGGVSLPEVLHFAHRTLCFSPPIEHTPTSPNHEITPSGLEVVSIDDFRSAKISEKRKPKCRRRNQNCVSVRRRTLAN